MYIWIYWLAKLFVSVSCDFCLKRFIYWFGGNNFIIGSSQAPVSFVHHFSEQLNCDCCHVDCEEVFALLGG